MGLRGALERVGREYPSARHERFKGHPTVGFLRIDACDAVRAALPEGAPLRVRASAGPSVWATVPWLAVFDEAVTLSAARGFYVVYLWSADGARATCSLIVGTAGVRKAYGDGARDVLRDRAWWLRNKAGEVGHPLPHAPIDLASDKQLPRDYEAGHAAGFTYELGALPEEAALVADLRRTVSACLAVAAASGPVPTVVPVRG